MKLRALTIGFSIFAMSSHALAQGEMSGAHDAVRFVYSASDGCPSKSDFAGLVKDRGVVIPESDSAPRALSVAMNPDPAHPEKWRGTLQIKDGTYLGSEKSAEGATCADVARSLAIFTSIALSPDPATRASAPATGAASSTSTSPTSETTSPAKPAASTNERPKDTYTEPDFENAPTLHRHRFALAAEGQLIFPLTTPSNAYGIGLTARYYVSERLGLRLDADFIRSENRPAEAETGLAGNGTPTTNFKPVTEIGGKGMLSAELLVSRAVSTLSQGHLDLRNVPADFILHAGLGSVWTRPLSFNDPAFRTFSYQASLAFELGWDARIFLTRSLAIDFGSSLTIYNAHEENTAVASTQAERADSTTWFGSSAVQIDLTTRASFELLF